MLDGIQIGFIGAGKVGVSLGKYFKEKGRRVGGYYSRSPKSAEWAAEFTGTAHYESLEEITSSCGMILFTVPDGAIAEAWEQAKPFVSGKIVGHCSGLYSSKIFSDIGERKSYAYSIHPLFAVSSKEDSWKELSDVLFTLEGDAAYIHGIEEMLQSMGNRTKIISSENKIKYHAAASLSSNFVTALFSMSQELLVECGFGEQEAAEELYPLMRGNLEHILKQGCVSSLTGPIERGDVGTVEKHLEVLDEEMRDAYRKNAVFLVRLAEKKHPGRDDSAMKELLSAAPRENPKRKGE